MLLARTANTNIHSFKEDENFLENAKALLSKLSSNELVIIKETEELFQQQINHAIDIEKLKDKVPSQKLFLAQSSRLEEYIDSSLALADEVCAKIKQFENKKQRFSDSLVRISDILDLRVCRDEVDKALKTKNYETAAAHIHRFLSIDLNNLKLTIKLLGDLDRKDNIIDPAHLEDCITELFKMKTDILLASRENMLIASGEDNKSDIDKYFKIFSLIGAKEEGIDRYASYISRKIKDPCELNEFKNKPHTDKLSYIYESIAKLILDHQPIIETFNGQGYLLIVITKLQTDCYRLARKILKQFCEEKQVQKITSIVRNSLLQQISLSKLDPREIDSLLNDFVMLISRSEVYLSFLVSKARENMNQKQANLEIYQKICIDCDLNHLLHEISDIYVMLEQYYLFESAKKAIMRDKIENTTCYMSSMVYDIFFIINICTKRAISTKGTEIFCAVVNHVVTFLGTLFLRVNEDRLKNQYFSSSQFAALNNLSKACEHLEELQGVLGSGINKLKPPLGLEQKKNLHLEKSKACINELASLKLIFEKTIESSLRNLFNSTLRTKFRSELENYIDDNPDIANQMEANDALAANIVGIIDKSLENSLTSKNFHRLANVGACFIRSFVSNKN